MKTFKFITLCFCTIIAGSVTAQSRLVKNLEKGEDQTLVVYGTSITKLGSGPLWVNLVGEKLNEEFDNHLTLYNRGGSGRNSQWATQNFRDSVLSVNPSTVIFEFSVNDAVERFDIEPEQSKKNTQWMIDRLKEIDAEIILLVVASNPLREAATKRPNLEAYINGYRELAEENEIQLIDFSPVWKDILEKQCEKAFMQFLSDGVHPTKRGATEKLAPIVTEALIKGK
ncbi:MAG: GDSL-type esterase/lipase family protein [Candidatus Symbiothrix sp.]|jgi:lysophospholipase L1-like esterase|nr:GDSL-type esterase/lipase family protein [Candidatus Symbiothrix sp.]